MAKRGRPKGSGIDDREILSAIAGRLASTPGLKPTTAIRQAGVDDPSVIRRLRDKLRLEPPPAAPARARRPVPPPARPPAAKQAPARKPQAALKPQATKQTQRASAAVSRGTPAAAKPARDTGKARDVRDPKAQTPTAPPQQRAPSAPEPAQPPPPPEPPQPAQPVSWLEAQLAATATLLSEQARMCDAFLPLTPLPHLLRQQAALLGGLLHMLRDQEKK